MTLIPTLQARRASRSNGPKFLGVLLPIILVTLVCTGGAIAKTRDCYRGPRAGEPTHNAVPEACAGVDAATTDAHEIGQCTQALKLMIDIRFAHFSHALEVCVAARAPMVDTTVLGLSTAGSLAPSSNASALRAFSSGATEMSEKPDNNHIAQLTVPVLLAEMVKLRGVLGDDIRHKIETQGYRTMHDALGDLQAYDRAGTVEQATLALQALVATQNTAP
jgi:hypothetical protein